MIRARLLLVVVGVPAAISVSVAVGVGYYLSVSAPRPLQSVAEAVLQRNGIRLVERIRAGDDPRTPVVTTLPGVADGRPIAATPLLIAVARDDDDFVRLLTSIGIPWSRDELQDASCLASMRNGGARNVLGDPGGDPASCEDRLTQLADDAEAAARR